MREVYPKGETAASRVVAMSLVNKAATLAELERSEEAIAGYDEVVSRFGEPPAEEIGRQVARALVEK